MTAIPSSGNTGAASPGLLEVPAVELRIDGGELNADAAWPVAAIRVRQEVSAPAVCEVELEVTAAAPDLRPGSALTLRTGLAATPLFDGELVAVGHTLDPQGRHLVRLRAFDRSHLLRQSGQARAFTDCTVADLAGTLAEQHGLGVTAQSAGPRWPRVIQRGESDLALMTRLTTGAGLWWQLDADQIRLRSWDDVVAERELSWRHELLEAVVESDATARPGSVRTLGWDPVEREVWDTSVTGARGAAPASTQLAAMGADRDGLLAGRVLPGSDHATALAQADLDRRTMGAATIRAITRGDQELMPGIRLRIGNAPPGLEGPYLITGVEHVIDALSGYVCILSSKPPVRTAEAEAPDVAAFTLARVIEVDDHQRAGRVRVTFPVLDDVESEWLPVLTLGAGEGKGLLCQPDVDDTVLVLHAAADPGRGVVLGGLYAGHDPAEAAGVRDGSVRRLSWSSADGQHLDLDRDGDQAVLGNAAGSMIEFTGDKVTLHAAADLIIEAPGRKLLIRADTIDFERG